MFQSPKIVHRYQYGPYGEPMHYDNDQERQGFIGKERDLESNLADHGVRKYDYMTGRFTSIDPLWEKYLGLTPWQYAGNNPVNALDENGKTIQAISSESQEMIQSLVPVSLRQYIVFDSQGCIYQNIINSVSSESQNFMGIQALANHQLELIVDVTDKFNYKDTEGNPQSIEFGKIRIDNNWEPGLYSLSTNELGFQGVTLTPGNEDYFNSPNNNIYVYINSNLSKIGRRENASHEFLGHAFFYVFGLTPGHIYLPDQREGNVPLKNQILQSTEETRENNIGY